MATKKIYGDENSGYTIPAWKLSPQGARQVIRENINDGIYMQMPDVRLIALEKRARDSE